MGPVESKWAEKIRSWEQFTNHLMNYMFHTDEGRRIRGRFVRETILRALFYLLLISPGAALLAYFEWLSLGSPVGDFLLLILVGNLALGISLLRSVQNYRHRIQLHYLFTATQQTDDDTLPVGHTEVSTARLDRTRAAFREAMAAQLAAESAEAAASVAGATGIATATEPMQAPAKDEPKVTMMCKKCGNETTRTLRMARSTNKCQYCGGELASR